MKIRHALTGLMWAVCLFAFVPPSQVDAQVSVADSAAVLIQAADAFLAEGNGGVARALYRYIVERFPGTAQAERAAAVIRSERFSAAAGGATELQVWGTTYGIFLGIALPTALGAEDAEAFGVGLLLGGPAGFIAARKAAQAKQYTVGQARAITLGGSWGVWQGYALSEILDLGESFHCDVDFCNVGGGEEETAWAMIGGSALGLAVGSFLARKPISDGAATGANFGGLWGTWFGTALGVVADIEGDGLLTSAVVGGNVGLAAAALSADELRWSRSRWRIVSAAGLLGAIGGFGIDLIAGVDDSQAILAIPLITSVAGLAMGIYATRGDPNSLDGGEQNAGSLMGWQSGSLSLQPPAPYPVLHALDGPRGIELKPALGVTLFRAVF